MPHDVIATCPVCSNELAVTRLHCRSCGTTLEGEFSVGRFGRLSREQLALLESFLRSRGQPARDGARARDQLSHRSGTRRGPRSRPRVRRSAGRRRIDRERSACAIGTEILEALARHEMSAEDAAVRDPFAWEDRLMTATFRVRSSTSSEQRECSPSASASGEVRLRAVDGTASESATVATTTSPACSRSTSPRAAYRLAWTTAAAGSRLSSTSPELDVDVPRRAAVVIESGEWRHLRRWPPGDQRYRTASGNLAMRALRRADRSSTPSQVTSMSSRPPTSTSRRGPFRATSRSGPGFSASSGRLDDERRPEDRRPVLGQRALHDRDGQRRWRSLRRSATSGSR